MVTFQEKRHRSLSQPTHCPMGSRRGDPAAKAAPLDMKNVINGEG